MLASDNTVPDDGAWVWPVPDLLLSNRAPRPSTVYYPATQSQEFRRSVAGTADHLGVDIMFRRLKGDTLDQARYAAGSPDGTERWFAPPGTPIVAARDGNVWSVGQSPRGLSIVLDHGHPESLGGHGFATYYQHLESSPLPLVRNGHKVDGGGVITVKAGDVIGYMGGDPLDARKLRHLHFAVWRDGAGDPASVDPARSMRRWRRTVVKESDLAKGTNV